MFNLSEGSGEEMGEPKKCAACGKKDCAGKCVEPRPGKCTSCKRKTRVMPVTGMCGPCTFGDSDTEGGNW